MIPNNIEYYIFRDNDWHMIHQVGVRGFMGVIVPTVGTIMSVPGLKNDYKVTMVRFNMIHNDIEIEMVELWGTGE
jgi:hypothetical protein